MMISINETFITGYLGANAEIKIAEDGRKTALLKVVSKQACSADSSTENETWHRVIAYQENAEYADNYLYKGATVLIRGPIRTCQYIDANSNECYFSEIVALSIQMLDGGTSNHYEPLQPASPPSTVGDVDDSIPFGL